MCFVGKFSVFIATSEQAEVPRFVNEGGEGDNKDDDDEGSEVRMYKNNIKSNIFKVTLFLKSDTIVT